MQRAADAAGRSPTAGGWLGNGAGALRPCLDDRCAYWATSTPRMNCSCDGHLPVRRSCERAGAGPTPSTAARIGWETATRAWSFDLDDRRISDARRVCNAQSSTDSALGESLVAHAARSAVRGAGSTTQGLERVPTSRTSPPTSIDLCRQRELLLQRQAA